MSETVRILRIAAGGDGVGKLADGRTVFVPRTAPGDLAELTDLRLHARFARGRMARLVEASPERVTPRCAHYEADRCGGCQLQHLGAPAQRAARRAIVGDALRRIGRVDVGDPELEAAVEEWGYRTRISLAVDPVTRRAGFHRADDAAPMFPLARCEIADQRLNVMWDAVRAAADRWPPALDQIVLRLARDDSPHVAFRGAVRPDEALIGALAAFTVWWVAPDSRARRLSPGVASVPAGMPPGVFEQVHRGMGARVRAHALAELGDVRGRHVWDLYAGIGETSAALEAAGASVESVELDSDAVIAAQDLGPLTGVDRYSGRVEEWIGRLRPAWAAVMNPPRAGLEAAAIEGLLAVPPARLVYISCDPATLARDVARLRLSYRLTGLRAFDLFPQTAHVETVARFDLA